MLYYVVSLLSQIYCDGPILQAVQDARLFADSKYFVDMPLKQDPVSTLRDFYALGDRVKDSSVLEAFVESHFEPPGVGHCICTGYGVTFADESKTMFESIKSVTHFSMSHIHSSSLAGGFGNFITGIRFGFSKVCCSRRCMTRQRVVILNLIYMVDHHGFVPNGGRIYYLSRSQPPLLTPMVYEYFLATGDLDFVHQVLPTLEKEQHFWNLNRARSFLHPETNEELFQYYQYRAAMKGPRPESYREDMELAKGLSSAAEREAIWSNVASAAETGWDFSTRWFAQEGPGMHDIKSIRTWSIVPVDLNAFMCINMRYMAAFYEIFGNIEKKKEYYERYQKMKLAIKRLHWNETDGIWYDYDLEREAHSNTYYVSNALPLYSKCYDDEDDVTPHKVFEYLKREGVLNFTKGIPTSLAMGSIQQWDKENAWPPMVHMVVEGFRTSGDLDLMKAAEQMATQWLIVNYKGYVSTYAMFEKYNASMFNEEGCGGSGGEYEVQKGFGWTNGVILDLLDKYGAKISVAASAVPIGAPFFPLTLTVTTLLLMAAVEIALCF
uniref:Trehalase n=1 Tax=Globodera rostochiensis TaxID=31243 RepID=A0A914I4H6_GLORO